MEASDTISDTQLSDEKEALAEDQAKQTRLELDALLDDLAKSIESKFFERAVRRRPKEIQWRISQALVLGNLAVDSFADDNTIKAVFGKTPKKDRPYYNIVANKCDIAVAQCVDMQFSGGEKNWSLSASVDTNDPLEAEKARLMERTIQAQLERCAYGRKVRRAIEDRVQLGTGIIKGPVNTGRTYTKYEPTVDENGQTIWLPVPAYGTEPSIEHVSPWFFFPDDTVNDFCMASDCIEVHPCSALDLKKYMNNKGFDKEAIKQVLLTKPDRYLDLYYSDYKGITDTNPYLFEDKYMLLEYHGPITLDALLQIGITPSYESPNEEYYGEVWVVGGKVIRIELENIEASYELPYGVSVWKRDPASIFGFGSPLLMKDAQRVAREVWRMILDNAAASSGPQIAMHRTFVEPQNGDWEMQPWKYWLLLDSSVDVQKAIQFFNVPNYSDQLIGVLELSRKFAEEESSTPMIAGGLEGGELTESATGQLLMRTASTTVLEFLSEDWDDNITEKVIRRMYAWNMQYNKKDEIKGNYTVDVKTISEYKNKQMQVRDLERLHMLLKQDPEASIFINRDELFRAQLAAMSIPNSAIVRTPEEIEQIRQQMAEAAANQPDPAVMELQLKAKELELKERELALKEQQAQFEATLQQQREAWEHEQKMAANAARFIEAQSRVLATQNEKEIQLLQLYSSMEDKKAALAHAERIAVMNNETKLFMEELKASQKARDQLLTMEEMRLKNRHGTGI